MADIIQQLERGEDVAKLPDIWMKNILILLWILISLLKREHTENTERRIIYYPAFFVDDKDGY